MRFVRGIPALVLLFLGLIGVPWALLTLGGNPFPAQVDPAAIGRALLRPDDGTVLIGLITVIGWIAWGVFTLSVLTELVAILSRQRIRIPLPGLRGVQRGVGVLLILVVAMLALPHPSVQAAPSAPPVGQTRSASASPGPASPGPAATLSARPAPSTAGRSAAAPNSSRPSPPRVAERPGTPTLVHVVRPGDELWTLAEHYYGHGREWRRIAEANPHLLSGGPDKLDVGWKLMIPGPRGGSQQASQTAAERTAGEPDGMVRVERGDTLSGIAEDAYGDAQAWPGLYRANRDQIDDPDLIDVGEELHLPATVRAEAGTFRRLDPREMDRPGDARSEVSDQAPTQHDEPRGDRTSRTAPASSPAPSARALPSAPPSAAPSQPAPSQAAPSQAAPSQAAPSQAAAAESDHVDAEPVVLAGIGGLLAAGLVGGLALRRRIQLQSRPVGRRIAHAPAPAQLTEAQLGRRQTPLGLGTLDLALRSVGLHSLRTGQPLPLLQAARVSAEEIELWFTDQPEDPWPDPPTAFRCAGRRWLLDAADAGYLAKLPGIDVAAQPYPGLTPVGVDADEVQLLVNLELAGITVLDDRLDRRVDAAGGSTPSDGPSAALRAMAAALAFSPWSEEVVVTVVGGDRALVEAVDSHTISYSDDVDRLLDRWEQRATTQRRHLGDQPAQNHRIDPDLADPWVPEIALVDTVLTEDQAERLERLILSQPPVTMAAVVLEPAPPQRPVGEPPRELLPGAQWRLSVDASTSLSGPSRVPGARLEPLGWVFETQQLSADVAGSVRELVRTTGSEFTTSAPWWNEPVLLHPTRSATRSTPNHRSASRAHPEPDSERASHPDGPSYSDLPAFPDAPEPDSADPEPPVAPRRGWPISPVPSAAFTDPADNVTFIGGHAGRRVASEESATVAHPAAAGPNPVRHPSVQLLGPIELLGAAGQIPTRAGKQCIEYCAWLLEHPGRSAREMATALVVAEGTRRSNMSRLRAWLGEDADGTPYLPDAYSGRIMLAAVVSSDWHRLQILTGPGVNATSTEGLQAALSLVRGAPLADAAPGSWYWAEEMRTDMVSVIRDIGVELSSRALADKDLELARWATVRSLTAAPHDERLLAMRIRVEHQAGNLGEVERLSLQMSAHARLLGLDLDPETVDLLQQVMEGQIRARA